jgi:hypothetical protein
LDYLFFFTAFQQQRGLNPLSVTSCDTSAEPQFPFGNMSVCEVFLFLSILFVMELVPLTQATEIFDIATVQSQMCFLTATSSNHYFNSLKYIFSTQKIYPCSKVYIYDLGNKAKIAMELRTTQTQQMNNRELMDILPLRI